MVIFLYILESVLNYAYLHLLHLPVSARYPKVALHISFLLLIPWILGVLLLKGKEEIAGPILNLISGNPYL